MFCIQEVKAGLPTAVRASIRDRVVPVPIGLIGRRRAIVGETRRSLSKHQRTTLRAAVEAYERLIQDARALTAGQTHSETSC